LIIALAAHLTRVYELLLSFLLPLLLPFVILRLAKYRSGHAPPLVKWGTFAFLVLLAFSFAFCLSNFYLPFLPYAVAGLNLSLVLLLTAIASFPIAFTLAKRKRKNAFDFALSWALVGITTLFLTCLAFRLIFWNPVRPCKLVKPQDGLTAIAGCTSWAHNNSQEACSIVSHHLYDLVYHPELDSLFVTRCYTSSKRQLIRLPLGDGLIEAFGFDDIGFAAQPQFMSFAPRYGLIAVSLFDNSFSVVFSPAEMRIKRRLFEQDESRVFDKSCIPRTSQDKLYMFLEEREFVLHSYDFKSDKETIRELGSTGSLTLVACDPKGKFIITGGTGTTRLSRISTDTLTIDKSEHVGLFKPLFEGWITNDGKRLYATNPLPFGRVYVFDTDSLQPIDTIPVKDGIGIRDIVVDEDDGLAFVANFFNGTVSVIDVETKKTISQLYVGPLPRNLYLCPKTNRVFAISYCGAFEILHD